MKLTVFFFILNAAIFSHAKANNSRPIINVVCACHYISSNIEFTTMASGEIEASVEDLKSCQISDGEILHPEDGISCLRAIEDAFFNCDRNVNAFKNPYETGRVEIPVSIDVESCQGQIEIPSQDEDLTSEILTTHLTSQ